MVVMLASLVLLAMLLVPLVQEESRVLMLKLAVFTSLAKMIISCPRAQEHN